MPRGRKRAGTPIERGSKQARHEDEPMSETGISNGESADVGGSGGEETPKPKTRTRKTPKKLAGNTPIPSSQASGKTTGRKRGRPRKVPLPEQSNPQTGVSPQITHASILGPPALDTNTHRGSRHSLPTTGEETYNSHIDGENIDPTPNPVRQGTGTTPVPRSPSQDRTTVDGHSVSPTSSNQLAAENDDLMLMSDDYGGAEPQSDSHSTEDEDGITHHGQDTIAIADASDFSMIAVESLPSFQASFRASLQEDTTKLAPDYQEMGEQTSHIINQTLESLRHSLRSQIEGDSQAAEVQADIGKPEDRIEDREEVRERIQEESSMTTNHEERRGFFSSPRRSKHIPLSRHVFVGRGNVDDSFSTIPDSILHAATPGRLPPKATDLEQMSQAEQADTYNDSFSEIPEAILEAATPRRARRGKPSPRMSIERNEDTLQTTHPPGRRSSPDYGSNRLPTPEETSSSNAGSRKAQEEDTGAGPEYQEHPGLVNNTDVPSSPPIRTRPRALDFGHSKLQTELNTVQGRRSSSSQRQLFDKIAPTQLHSLEAPHRSSRPSLSPIVRVGRTLQNVMSDHSSPDTREANLGSPFRGSASSDHPHQSLVPASSSPSVRAQKASHLGRSFRSSLGQPLGRASYIADETAHSVMSEDGIGSRTGYPNNATTHQPPETLSLPPAAFKSRSTEQGTMGMDGETQRVAQSSYFQQPSQEHSLSQITNAQEPDITQVRSIGTDNVPSADTYAHIEQRQTVGDEPRQEIDEENDMFEVHAGGDESEGDELDVWDIEASRMSPTKPESPRNTANLSTKRDAPSSRRSKVPSPWRRNNRRLIYKDDIASSSQIEIEESSQSETEQSPPVPPAQRQPEPRPRPGASPRAADAEPLQQSPISKDINMLENVASPSPIQDDLGEHVGLADSDELDDVAENEAPAVFEQIQWSPEPVREESEHQERDQLEARGIPPAHEASMDMSEYSLVAQQAKKTPQEQKKPPPSKPGFFGSFDILSFFSSPAVIPTDKSGPKPPEPTNKDKISPPKMGNTQQKEPLKGFWSTGLFPAMPHQEAPPSFAQRPNPSSPRTTLHSTDTVADTYEPSSSIPASPTPSRSASAAPSTPERQAFPPIEQKRNFTPRPGQSGSSLFALSQANAVVIPDGVNSDTEGYSEEQESSALTETSEYERVPPREKPSRWDRNLSPTKSSFRSPLKPTTPGRVVAFLNSALSPLIQAQAQARDTIQTSTSAHNAISQGPLLRPTVEGKENQPHPHHSHTQQNKRANNDSSSDIETNLKRPRASASSQDHHHHPPPPQQQQQQPSQPSTIPTLNPAMKTTFALSQTEWTRQHWCRLDEILQLRRRDHLRFQQTCPLPPRDKRNSSAILGNEIFSEDSQLILETWHLEIVEAFKLEVGGWDEVVLAKRLFALIIGEEQRRRARAVR
ncbi:hypothetical protein NPX13_g9408 [Xylaria arbuscula]|uniref:Uncharacterized protein n=1 Tax=Xylaria arbuscula TaxID=114810 RepID=A0A9W8TJ28_9PEZI|nr:hypothetical protein NPX13_g9408 [Xylaria arbuscula]